jgi:seryl-tRNA synthetase
LKKLIGNTDIEDSLQRLDKLTQEEARMASAEQLRIAHSIEGKVMGVDERVQGVGDDVKNVVKKVEDVDNKVQAVDRKLDDTARSLSPIAHTLIPNAQVYSQGTCSATIFYDGSRLQIHQ